MLDTKKQRIIAGAAAGVLLLGGIGFALTAAGDDPPPPTTTTTEATTTTTVAPTTTVPEPVAPLTGLTGSFQGRLDRPALVVKIDNGEPKARPQAGLNQADVVYEERVEGSVTRLLAIFHSTDAAPIGPVRSARTSDIAIFTPLHRPFFAWSGANGTFAQRIRAAEIHDVGYDALVNEYYREPGRPAPDNLMLRSSVTVTDRPAEGSSPPPAIFEYRQPGQPTAHLVSTTGVAISYGTSAGSAPVEYRWNGDGWARTQKGTPHVDAQGVQVAPENVIIEFVDYRGTDVNDQFGVPIPEAQMVGEGEAWILTGGGLVKGRWLKNALGSITTYTDEEGNPILLTPGRTWVALPAPGGARTI